MSRPGEVGKPEHGATMRTQPERSAAILAANWGRGPTTEQGNPSTAVPEPGVLVWLVLVAGGRWRRVR